MLSSRRRALPDHLQAPPPTMVTSSVAIEDESDVSTALLIQLHILFNINHTAVSVNSRGFNIHNRIVTF